jgi:hypothetical protein
MTHEFLSMMLGVRRAGVSVAAGALQKAGLIRYERGRMSVIDRPGLEAVACECHVNMRREFRRLLGCCGDTQGARPQPSGPGTQVDSHESVRGLSG